VKGPGGSYTLAMSDVGVGIDHAFAYVVPTSGGPTDYIQGTYLFYTRATDVADNAEAAPADPDATTAQTLQDSIAPDTNITAEPSNPTNSASGSFSFNGSDPGGSGVASFECNLDGAGFTTCTSPKSYSGLADGSHTFQVQAVDNAGNRDASPASFTWLIDTVKPDTNITAQPSNPTNSASGSFSFNGSEPGGCGVASFECKLDGAGFTTCTSPKSYSGLADGSHTFQVRAIDAAGNTDATPASFSWLVDTTAPVTMDDAPTGWQNHAVTVHLSPTDSGSGVANTYYKVDGDPTYSAGVSVTIAAPADHSNDGVHTIRYYSTDDLGNTESVKTATVKIDTANPTITGSASPAANPLGWNNSNVTVSFSCADGLSGIDTCEAAHTLNSDGASQSVTGQAKDNAGNQASATVSGINIDKTKPVVAVSGVSSGATYVLGSVPAAGCSTSDALSGVKTAATLSSSGGPVGSITASCNGAEDKAGNTNSASVTYTVNYNFTGFFAPVDNDPTCNVVKAGSAVPIKFSLHGYQGMNIFTSGPTASTGTCVGAALDTVEETVTAGGSSLNYDSATDQYIYVWKTDKAWAGKAIRFSFTLGDGTPHWARFTFTK
jgi:hypothetical protein